MFTTNPFAELSATIPSGLIQAYVILMILLVVGGTLYDVWHKGSAKYFFDNWNRTQAKGARSIGGGEVASLAVQTVAKEVLTSAEFADLAATEVFLGLPLGFVLGIGMIIAGLIITRIYLSKVEG